MIKPDKKISKDDNVYTNKYILEQKFDKLSPGPEGILIQVFGDNILLPESSKNKNECERGTTYAVYEFLERFLGFSLSAYTKEGVDGGEYIPKKAA